MDFYSWYWNSMFRYLSVCFAYPHKNKYRFFVIGLPLAALWLCVDNKSKLLESANAISEDACICTICEHKEAKLRLQRACACCLIMKGNTIIGHSVNTLR